MDVGREGWYPADCGLNWYTSSNAFSDNGKTKESEERSHRRVVFELRLSS